MKAYNFAHARMRRRAGSVKFRELCTFLGVSFNGSLSYSSNLTVPAPPKKHPVDDPIGSAWCVTFPAHGEVLDPMRMNCDLACIIHSYIKKITRHTTISQKHMSAAISATFSLWNESRQHREALCVLVSLFLMPPSVNTFP